MRLVACVEYDGSAYRGWQRLSHADSVQQQIEQALSKVANESIQVICAGRTDSGVHATGQIIHFDTQAQRSIRGWLFGTNSHLPQNIAVRWIEPIDMDFHARFSAIARRYRYMIVNRLARPALLTQRAAWYYYPLDTSKMHEAAQVLIGEQDFSSFRATGCQASHARREVQQVSVIRQKEMIYIDIQANAFLYHMVRNIVGSLLEIGAGKQATTWMAELLTERNRDLAGATAPAAGLYFVKAIYPEKFALPDTGVLPVITV